MHKHTHPGVWVENGAGVQYLRQSDISWCHPRAKATKIAISRDTRDTVSPLLKTITLGKHQQSTIGMQTPATTGERRPDCGGDEAEAGGAGAPVG